MRARVLSSFSRTMTASAMLSSPPEETTRWYADKVARYGYDHRGLGFGQRSSQERRFEALLGLGDFDGARLLDVGCGFGDFLAFLHRRGIRPRYTGIDACAPMVKRCVERFESNADSPHFLVADVLAHEPGAPYDYVVASGLFGLDAEGGRDRIRPTLDRMFRWASRGMAANFLSTCSPSPVGSGSSSVSTRKLARYRCKTITSSAEWTWTRPSIAPTTC